MKTSKQQTKTARNANGQSMIQGALSLSLIVGIIFAATLVLLNIGMAIHYKQRISFMTRQVAEAAAAQLSWGGSYNNVSASKLESDCKLRMNDLLKNAGLPSNANVSVKQDYYSVAVTASVSNLPMFGEGTFIPNLATINSTSSVELSASRPPGTLTLSVTGSPNDAVSIPCYGFFKVPFSSGSTDFNKNVPPSGVAAFRSQQSPAGYGQAVFSVPTGSSSADRNPVHDSSVFAAGFTPPQGVPIATN